MENIEETFRTVKEEVDISFFGNWENVSGYTGGDGAIPSGFTETINYENSYPTTEDIDIIVQAKVQYINAVIENMNLTIKREDV
jgi:hypothetical protein